MHLIRLESASNFTSIFVISPWVKRQFIQLLGLSPTWLDSNPSSTTYKRVKYMNDLSTLLFLHL